MVQDHLWRQVWCSEYNQCIGSTCLIYPSNTPIKDDRTQLSDSCKNTYTPLKKRKSKLGGYYWERPPFNEEGGSREGSVVMQGL